MRIEPLGDSALLVRVVDEFDPEKSLDAVLRAAHALEFAAIPGVIELAPAYTTIGVFFDPARIARSDGKSSVVEAFKTGIEHAIQTASESGRFHAAAPVVIEVPVCYETEFAPDL